MPARALADANNEYAELAALGETPVLTILLNDDYSPLKKYLQRRQPGLSKIGAGHAHNRYAIDVGVALPRPPSRGRNNGSSAAYTSTKICSM